MILSPKLLAEAEHGDIRERHFDATLAFQNCHRVAAFRPEARGGETHGRCTAVRSQVLNQSPEFRDC
ncbi:hypothetical protein HHX38_13030 [Streptomyces sp. PKU-MA01144]|nr:hypothetical protein [Streptomyces sp. PKU-MA01144]